MSTSNQRQTTSNRKKTAKSSFAEVEEYLNRKFDFRLNEVSNTVEFRRIPETTYEEVCEESIYRDIQLNGLNFSLSDVRALLESDYVEKYDPIVEYMKNLPEWTEGKDEDHIKKLSSYVEAVDQDRFEVQFKKAFVRTVACALTKEYFNKHALILVDAPTLPKITGQNMGKSTFCRELCPPSLQHYYTEEFATNKDGLIALSENVIVNLDELSVMGRAEINQVKSFISKQKIKARPHYGRRAVLMVRRASFVGSTNNAEFLTDETGSVRWLCFEVQSIDWAYRKEVDIDLVWSQAYNLYHSGFDYNLTAEEIEENEKENQKHFVSTPELDLLQQYYQPAKENEPGALFMTATDVIDKIKDESQTQSRLHDGKMGKALKALGFTKTQRYNGQYQVKGYYLKPIEPNQPELEDTEDGKVPF